MALIDAQFTLPTTRCPLAPPRLHQQETAIMCERVRLECDPCILKLARPDARKLLLDIFPCYVCRLFPSDRNHARLRIATNFIAWLTLSHNIVHNAGSLGSHDQHGCASSTIHDYSSWTHCVLSKLQLLKHHPPTFVPDALNDQIALRSALLTALGELWGELSPHLTPQAQSRFISAMKEHLQAVSLQQELKSAFVRHERCDSIENISIGEYMSIRCRSSGFLVGLELLHFMLGLDDDPIHVHPLVEKIRDLVIDYMSMCNDMVLCRMEVANSDVGAGDHNNYTFNLPCVMCKMGMATSMEEAIQIVVNMMECVDARCVHTVETLQRDLDDLMLRDPRLNAYLTTMVSCMSGALSWSLEAIRYRLAAARG